MCCGHGFSWWPYFKIKIIFKKWNIQKIKRNGSWVMCLAARQLCVSQPFCITPLTSSMTYWQHLIEGIIRLCRNVNWLYINDTQCHMHTLSYTLSSMNIVSHHLFVGTFRIWTILDTGYPGCQAVTSCKMEVNMRSFLASHYKYQYFMLQCVYIHIIDKKDICLTLTTSICCYIVYIYNSNITTSRMIDA